MRSLIGGLTLAALLPLPAVGQDAGVSNEHQPTSVRIRILRDDLNPALVAWLADNAKPQQLTADAYPSLAGMRGAEVAGKLCGYVPAVYWRSLEKLDALAAGSFSPGDPLGTRGYTLAWPACFYVERGEFSHVLGKDELASEIYLRETGSPGSPRTHSNFFARSGIADPSKVSVATTLRYGFRTRPTLVTPVGDRDTFLFELTRQAAAAKPGMGLGFKTLLASIDKGAPSGAALQQVRNNGLQWLLTRRWWAMCKAGRSSPPDWGATKVSRLSPARASAAPVRCRRSIWSASSSPIGALAQPMTINPWTGSLPMSATMVFLVPGATTEC